jgi:hypothetical protein
MMDEQEREARLREEIKALHTIDFAYNLMINLVTIGYQKLGLTDETRDLQNLDDARLAIEMLRGVIEAVDAVAGGHDVAPFRSTLAALQLNYARVATESASAAASPAASGDAAGQTSDEPANDRFESADAPPAPEGDRTDSE